jgi:hypothetical protein
LDEDEALAKMFIGFDGEKDISSLKFDQIQSRVHLNNINFFEYKDLTLEKLIEKKLSEKTLINFISFEIHTQACQS